MPYGDFKDFLRRVTAGKVLLDKAFNIAKNSKYAGYQRGLSWIVYKFWIKCFLLLKLKYAKPTIS